MEANDSYSRAEVDRYLTKDKESQEFQQRLQYRIECLETELDNANRVSLKVVFDWVFLVQHNFLICIDNKIDLFLMILSIKGH